MDIVPNYSLDTYYYSEHNLNCQGLPCTREAPNQASRQSLLTSLHTYVLLQAVKPDAVLHSNQALCNLRLGNWDDVIDSCDKAIKLDSCSIKAYFLKGQALIELGKFDPGVICLKTGDFSRM